MKSDELEAQLERLHPECFGWAMSCCSRDQMEAEDVLQTSYLKVVSGQARFGGQSSFKTWLFGVIRLTAQESARKAGRQERRTLRLVPDQIEAIADPQDAAEEAIQKMSRAESTRALTEGLQDLSARQQEVLHLVFYQDLTIEQAAEVMGISLGSARTHYQRGKKRLRGLLREDLRRDA